MLVFNKSILLFIGILHYSPFFFAMHSCTEVEKQIKKVGLIKHVLDKNLQNSDVSDYVGKIFFKKAVVSELESYYSARKLNISCKEIAFFSENQICEVLRVVDIKNKIKMGYKPAIARTTLRDIKRALPGALRRKILGNDSVKIDVYRPWYQPSPEDVDDILSLGMVGGAFLGLAGINYYAADNSGDSFLLKNILVPTFTTIGSALALGAFNKYAHITLKNSETQQYHKDFL